MRALVEATGLTPYFFAAYWAGYPAGESVSKAERGERARRFQTRKRMLYRWLADEQVIADENAHELVAVANRLLAERGGEPFPFDWLVTPAESRQAGMSELRGMLQEALERLARIEERLP